MCPTCGIHTWRPWGLCHISRQLTNIMWIECTTNYVCPLMDSNQVRDRVLMQGYIYYFANMLICYYVPLCLHVWSRCKNGFTWSGFILLFKAALMSFSRVHLFHCFPMSFDMTALIMIEETGCTETNFGPESKGYRYLSLWLSVKLSKLFLYWLWKLQFKNSCWVKVILSVAIANTFLLVYPGQQNFHISNFVCRDFNWHWI